MSSRTPRHYHVAGQHPASAESIEIPAEAVARFLNRLEPAEDSCMTLRRLKIGRPTMSSRPRRYGKVLWTDEHGNVQQIRASRLALIIKAGPIADGLIACHRCDNEACVSGAHLYAGTYRDNEDDKQRARRNRRLGLPTTLHPARRAARACVEIHPG